MNVPGFPTLPGTGSYYYPNDQSARLVWYHDHAIGITRLNAYAGIASAYILIDDFEVGLVNSGLLPDLVGIPLVIQDKGFVSTNILSQDPTWRWGRPGDLFYPHEYEPNTFPDGTPNPKGRFDLGSVDGQPPAQGTMPLPPASIVPEGFMDTILVNGGVYPKVSVPPQRVRFRMLNGSQARFYHLNLYQEDSSQPGEANLNVPGPTMYQLGTEGGFLPALAVHTNGIPCPPDANDPTCANPNGPFNLLLAPAERADVVIDFNGVPANSSFILYADAPAPFPCGDSRNDYFTGDPDQTAIGGAPTTSAGFGPNTRTLMKITVTAGAGDTLPTTNWLDSVNAQLQGSFASGNQPALLYNSGVPWEPAFPFAGVVHRMLTLNEDFDEFGRLIQTLGTSVQNVSTTRGCRPGDDPTWTPPRKLPRPVLPRSGRS